MSAPQEGVPYRQPAVGPSPFSFQLRASICMQCGQPLAGPDGGSVQCNICSQVLALRPRATFLRPGGATFPGQQPPGFRAQDGRPLLPPPNIAFLWEGGGEIPAHREAEALVAWQGARRRAAAMDLGAGEELVMLTRALVTKAEREGDLPRVRATVEAGLEGVAVPRHRAILLGLMTRAAVRAGDLEGASAWLSCFDPPQDLEADSEHRLATAVVATARGDFNAVLQAIGSAFDQIAIQDVLDPMAVIFRVNALERVGYLPQATEQLRALMSAGPAMRNALERVQQQYRTVPLCQMTLPAVTAAHEQTARASAGTGKMAMGCLLMGVSVLPVVILLVVGIVGFVSGGSFSGFIPLPFSLIFVLAFGLWGFKVFRLGQRERRVFASGIRAQARVLSARPTGTRVNDIPEMRIDLEVLVQPPVRTAIRLLIQPGQQHVLIPGTMIFVRVDPRNPDVAVLDQ